MTLRFIFRVGVSSVGEGAEVFMEDCKFLRVKREGSHLCYDSCQANHVTMLRALMLNNGIRAGEQAHCLVVQCGMEGAQSHHSLCYDSCQANHAVCINTPSFAVTTAAPAYEFHLQVACRQRLR